MSMKLYILCFFTICSLWGGSVINLGTQKHKDKYYDGIDNLDYPGCFAMTELHHGNYQFPFLSFFVFIFPC